MITERSLQPSDFEILRNSIAKDASHSSWMTPQFFLEKDTVPLVFQDEDGTVLYLRMSSVLRIHIQFCDVHPERIRKVITSQFPSLVMRAKENKYKQIIFESVSRGLIAFLKRYFGIRQSPDEYVLELVFPQKKVE